jgi:scyllo-inositol 2-dehydrogenase (NADP+)
MKILKTALIGFGFSARTFHLPHLQENPHYQLVTILTNNPKNQADAKTMVPNVKMVTDYDDVLNDNDIDLVVLTVTNEAHYDYTKRALLKHKHVICEKPFVMTKKEATELFELSKAQNSLLRVFHNRKYDGDILTLESLIKEQDFGNLLSFHARFDRYVPVPKDNWRYQSGYMTGIYYDLAPHLVHHAVQLFGKPKAILNQLYYDRPNAAAVDHFEMQLIYPTMTCYLGAEIYAREPQPKMKLVGTQATYVKYGFDEPEVVVEAHKNGHSSVLKSLLITSPTEMTPIEVHLGAHYQFYRHFYEDVIHPKAEDVDALLAMMVVEIIETGMDSVQKQAIVSL